jgi:aryl-alcohol dehydrogenase-like predicted oxidoreductase
LKKRRIGSLEVSVVGLGGNNFGTDFFGRRCDSDETARVVHAALDAGVNLIDTGESYGTSDMGARHSEECIGLALGSRRGETVIATKFSNPSSRHPEPRVSDRIASAVEGSLRRLRTDWIDLYQHHHPDPSVPLEEVLEALDRLVRAGKVREVGCCNYSGAMIDAARTISLETGRPAFVSAQNGYNVLDPTPEAGVLDACANHGMFLLPHSPLASGVLTGKYRKGHSVPPDTRLAADTPIGERERRAQLSDGRLDTVERLEAFAQDRGHTLLELTFSWLVSQPVVASVIAGATRPHQVLANASAANWDLTLEDFDHIEAIIGRVQADHDA